MMCGHLRALRETQEGVIPLARVTGVPQRGQMLMKWPPTAIGFHQVELEGSHAVGGTALEKDRTVL